MTRYTTHGRKWTQQRELAREMRQEPTAAEEALWQRIRGRKVGGLKFRRQHAVDRLILDFYCVEKGIALEIDGGIHNAQRQHDTLHQQFLEDRGIRVLRFTNDEVLNHIDDVPTTIATEATNPAST